MKITQTIGYLRVSTDHQNVQNQKLAIFDYAQKNNLHLDKFIEVTISSRRAIAERRILETLNSLNEQDVLVVTELSRLGRSTVEVLTLVEQIIAKGITLIIIKENLRLNKHNCDDITNVVMLHVFSLLASLERNLISLRTKEGLAERKSRGVILGKPKGSIQKSIYDPQKRSYFGMFAEKYEYS